jgi:hypothetical protein
VRRVVEIEVQNETNQSQERIRFAAVPRIGEGLRLRGPDGMWASFDVLDVWYQKADFGDLWVPYIHVRITSDDEAGPELPMISDDIAYSDFPDDDFDEESEEESEEIHRGYASLGI